MYVERIFPEDAPRTPVYEPLLELSVSVVALQTHHCCQS